ncbi:DUF1932 domain-containing protein [Thermodesulfobacteriota bacterium]
MKFKTVGILSPGDMGHAFGQVLGLHDLRVITCLQGRSERTRALANKAHIEDVSTYQLLVKEADIILSILVPAQAKQAAQVVAQAIKETKSELIYVDCNAVAPKTAGQIDKIISAAGGIFVDGGIIGSPPKKEGKTRLYLSGPSANTMVNLTQFGIKIIVLGDQIGQASGIKMCNAALTKGLAALSTELLTAAEMLNISQALEEEFKENKLVFYNHMKKRLPVIPMKSRRYVGEMEEIAKTFEDVGLTPRIYLGAADIYRFVGNTVLAERTPEDPDPLPTLTEVIKTLSGCLSEIQ